MALENMANSFSGLPMESLIGSPLKAACDSQVMLARSTVDFIRDVGFEGEKTRTADFSYTKHSVVGQDAAGNDVFGEEKVGLEVPVLAIVNIPSLMVDDVDITFDMEVKSSESSKSTEDKSGKFSAKAKVGWGPVSVTATVSGSVASHKENTRSSDNSAKYHVSVHASQSGTPEGLMRVLDIISESVAPKSIDSVQKVKSETVDTADLVTAQEAYDDAARTLEKAENELSVHIQIAEIESKTIPAPSSPQADVAGMEKKVNESKVNLLLLEPALVSEKSKYQEALAKV